MAAKVLNDFQVKLVKQLPMDAIFISSLQARGFFSGNKLNTMNSKPTPADKVLYLLNDIMGSSVEFYIEKLLDAMEEYDKADNPPGVISQLALEMRSKMPDVMKTDVTKTDVTKTPVEPKKGLSTIQGATCSEPKVTSTTEQSGPDETKVNDSQQMGSDEKRVTKNKGNDSIWVDVIKTVGKFVCLIETLTSDGKSYGTGFIGLLQLDDKSSYVLVTNNHVLSNEEDAEKSSISFTTAGVDGIKLKEVMMNGSYKCSDKKKLDYAMVDIDWDKLKEKYKDVEYIDLTKAAEVKDNDLIYVFQHPNAGPLSFATSHCTTYDYLLLYDSETAPGSSGGPILKAVRNGYQIVGLHRRGISVNIGTNFTDILESIKGKCYEPRKSDAIIEAFYEGRSRKK